MNITQIKSLLRQHAIIGWSASRSEMDKERARRDLLDEARQLIKAGVYSDRRLYRNYRGCNNFNRSMRKHLGDVKRFAFGYTLKPR